LNFFSLFKRNLIYKFKKKKKIDKDSFPEKDLDQLFFYYGSDKADFFQNKNRKGHGFSKFYEKQLAIYKSKPLNILEIGSYAGASAAAFSKYFNNSKIFCFDINISNFKYNSNNINVYGLDIRNEKKVSKILDKIFKENSFEKFDIIIDDGSHYLSDILFALNFFFKFVNQGGTYVIEDFKHPNYYKYNLDIKDIFVDTLISKILKKEYFNSEFIKKENQKYIFSEVKEVVSYKGNLEDSDICFIQKK
jgi:predicted O-methyltransferase YrrM